MDNDRKKFENVWLNTHERDGLQIEDQNEIDKFLI